MVLCLLCDKIPFPFSLEKKKVFKNPKQTQEYPTPSAFVVCSWKGVLHGELGLRLRTGEPACTRLAQIQDDQLFKLVDDDRENHQNCTGIRSFGFRKE